MLPTSDLVGKTVVEAGFRTRFGLTVIGLRRGVVAHEGGLLDEALAVGDTLLLIGPWKDIRQLQSDNRDLAVIRLPAEFGEVLQVPGKAPQALACLAARRWVDGQRSRPERAGRADRLPADGCIGLH